MQKIALLLFSLFLLQSTSKSPVDANKSVVNFKMKAMGLFTVKGTYKGFDGYVKFNPDQLDDSKIEVCINTKTVDTGNKKRDDHIRSKDFLEAEKYPTICFISSSIKKHDNRYIATGLLTIRGITKQEKISFTYENNTINGNLNIKRLDYEIGKDVGSGKAGKNVEVEIKCVLH